MENTKLKPIKNQIIIPIKLRNKLVLLGRTKYIQIVITGRTNIPIPKIISDRLAITPFAGSVSSDIWNSDTPKASKGPKWERSQVHRKGHSVYPPRKNGRLKNNSVSIEQTMNSTRITFIGFDNSTFMIKHFLSKILIHCLLSNLHSSEEPYHIREGAISTAECLMELGQFHGAYQWMAGCQMS